MIYRNIIYVKCKDAKSNLRVQVNKYCLLEFHFLIWPFSRIVSTSTVLCNLFAKHAWVRYMAAYAHRQGEMRRRYVGEFSSLGAASMHTNR
ncbi:hypothetical protein C5167_032478 [Papaver somniferum]|uniref:Uncharacterized protein n=1 Tax=Papaver somniferum TaxID=3469 RepID=A0A4Y7KBK6_PAPSO|nr:hypothetical protein C5167_032478 [Papaver somniferum]